MAPDGQPGPGRNLAASDIGDTLDLDEAISAVAGKAERPALGRRLARSQDRDRDRIAGLERQRVTVDDDVLRFGHSGSIVGGAVTGASGDPGGRTAAPAEGEPDGGGR
jgi:hypothetical protein